MSSNFMGFQKLPNQAFAENFTCLYQELVNPLFYLLFVFPIWYISPFKGPIWGKYNSWALHAAMVGKLLIQKRL